MGKGTPSLSHALVCPGVTQVMDAVLSRLACPQHDLLLLYYPGQQKVVCVIKSVEHRTVSLVAAFYELVLNMAAPIEVQARQGRETKLSRTFGDELCAARWLAFKSHYELVIRANVTNRVENWLDQRYRAVQLRLQISGEPECWLNQAEESGEDWVQSGDAIVERFDRRFVTADGIEMAIRHFEDARQEVGEELGSFLSRLRRLAGYAFGMEGGDSRRSRVIWKFITGIQDEAVRRDIIRQKWIGADGRAKQYDVILSTAQDAFGVIRATEMSGPSVSAVKQDALVAAVQDLSRRVDRVLSLNSEDGRRYRPQQRQQVARALAIVSNANWSVGIAHRNTWADTAVVTNARGRCRTGNLHKTHRADTLRRHLCK